MSFELVFDPADIREGMQYSVRATLSRKDEMLFTTDRHYGVLTRGNGNTVDIELIRVAAIEPSVHEDTTPDASLTNTYWRLVSIGDTPYRHEGEQREPHLRLLTQNFAAAGRAGCNSFSGSYERYAESLRFGQFAVTQMACVSGMETERAFLEALAAVDRFEIDGDSLVLLDGDSKLLGFEAVYLQ